MGDFHPGLPMFQSHALRATLLLVSLSACRTLEFGDVTLVEHHYDDAARATHVTLAFELFYDDLPVQTLDEGRLTVIEDGVAASSEALTVASPEIARVPVTLLIDTSYSLYRTDAVATIKASAADFVEMLRADGYPVRIARFATDVEALDEVDDIPDSSDPGDGARRWTALYHAMLEVLRADDECVLVVFSDGADNYSHNHGVAGLEEVERFVVDRGRQVHAIGFGALRDEVDAQGVRGVTALKRLTVGGSFRYAASEHHFEDVFDFITRRMRSVYTLEYHSPHLDGTHELVIEAEAGLRSARSQPLEVEFGTPRTASEQ